MKKLASVVACICFFSASSLMAQSITGDWEHLFSSPEGDYPLTLSIGEDGTYSVDLGQDGSIEVKGTYSIDGDKLTMQDTSGEMMCDQKGVYSFKIEGKSMVFTRVEDGCEGRGAEETREFTKM